MKAQAIQVQASPQVKQMWMAWMRQHHPDIYHAALQATIAPVFDLSASMLAGMARSNAMGRLGSLGQDVTDLTAGDFSSSSDQLTASFALSSDVAPDINIPSTAAASASTSPAVSTIPAVNTLFNTLVATAANVATNALTGNSAALVQENAVRVQQGLPPLNPDGSVMTVAQMHAAGYTSAQIQQIESTLSGSGILNTTTLLLIGGAVLLLVLMSGKRG